MKIATVVSLISIGTVSSFVPLQKQQQSSRASFVVVKAAFDDADSLLDKLSSTDSTSMMTPPVPSTPPVSLPEPTKVAVDAADLIPSRTDVVPSEVADAAKAAVDAVTPTAADITSSLPSVDSDLPLLPIIGGAVVVLAAVAALATGGGDDKDSSSMNVVAAPTAAEGATTEKGPVDLSIPYDAAARLAFEKAGSPGDYSTFKAKYEADAVAEVKAKQKK